MLVSQPEARWAVLGVPDGLLPPPASVETDTKNDTAAGNDDEDDETDTKNDTAAGNDDEDDEKEGVSGGVRAVLFMQGREEAPLKLREDGDQSRSACDSTAFLPRAAPPEAVTLQGLQQRLQDGGHSKSEGHFVEDARSLLGLSELEAVDLRTAGQAGQVNFSASADVAREDVLHCANTSQECVLVRASEPDVLLMSQRRVVPGEYDGSDTLLRAPPGFIEFFRIGWRTGRDSQDKDAPLVEDQPPAILSVGAGSRHVVVLRSDGSVFTWGTGSDGQLGYDGSYETKRSLSPVPFFYNPGPELGGPAQDSLRRVEKIAAGAYHCLATAGGQLFGFGEYTVGRDGFDSTHKCTTPEPIPFFDGLDVTRMCGGWAFNCVEADGRYWTFGKNTYGQLMQGSGFSDGSAQVVEVVAPGEDAAVGIVCGYDFTFVLLASGELLAGGCNDVGQLCKRSTSGYDKSVFPVDRFRGRNVEAVFCGQRFALFRVDGAWQASGYHVCADENDAELVPWAHIPRDAELIANSVNSGSLTKAARRR
jgi:Regulator of chromosome condensation (RCC1) repeat